MEHRSQLQPRALILIVTFQTPLEVRIEMERGDLAMESLSTFMLGTLSSITYEVCSEHRCFPQKESRHLHAEKHIERKLFKRQNVYCTTGVP